MFIRSMVGIGKFFKDYFLFRRLFRARHSLKICLGDYLQQSGNAADEYFFQDLYVAQKILRANPSIHIDVGSRLNGFVAHVASFREIIVYDIRSQHACVENIKFISKDFTETEQEVGVADSVSCLHALEHFGLGRYGDKISPTAFDDGLKNLFNLVSFLGYLYLSVPIGIPKIVFNSHRVLDPLRIIRLSKAHGFELVDFAYYSDQSFTKSLEIESDIDRLSKCGYSLGIFTFRKLNEKNR
ncbi:MAG: DUF268 domain-containing protein [bacterium]